MIGVFEVKVVRVKHDLRFVFITLAGFLIVGATATWHAIGYLSYPAWFFEWSDVVLAFLCVYLATRERDAKSSWPAISLIVISAALVLIPLESTAVLPVFTTPNPLFYFVFSIPIVFLAYFIIFRERLVKNQKSLSLIFFLFILGTVMFVTYLFYSSSMRFPTDESVVDLFSAHLFLKGLNPYDLTNTSGSFAFYNYPTYNNTPITTGGYVYYLTYPALSFLTMVPAELLGLKESLIMYPFFAIPIILTWYRAWSRKDWLISCLSLLPFLSLSIYASQVALADLNIVWAVLLMASYYVLPRTKVSGLLYGLALSVKQFPAITLPFLLFFVYKEYGKKKASWWLISGIVAFLFVNGYFMVLNFSSFVHAMLADELSPLIGVGFGPSQLSFLGYLSVPSVYFSIAMGALVLSFFVVYVFRYKEVKYALFAFPIIIFLFNYRLFVQYILYWLIISLLPFVDLLHNKEIAVKEKMDNSRTPWYTGIRNWKVVSAIIVAIMLGSVAVGVDQGVYHNPGSFTVNSVTIKGYNSTGYVNKMTVSVTFNGKSGSSTPVFFRFVLPQPIGNANMYLWKSQNNITLKSGQTETLVIVPVYSIDPLPTEYNYRMIAYYHNIMGSITGRT